MATHCAEQGHGADAVNRAAQAQRVCRAWHRASQVKVLAPGVRAAEGEEKGQGTTARWGLEEAPSKDAGRRTGTGYEVWYTRDERARAREVLQARWGVLDQSGVYASQAQCLTPGDLPGVHVEGLEELGWHRRETRRKQSKQPSS